MNDYRMPLFIVSPNIEEGKVLISFAGGIQINMDGIDAQQLQIEISRSVCMLKNLTGK